MGDRSNVVIEETWGEAPTRVYLYGHWAGQRIATSAIHGLNSGRGTDSAYLARIVFEDMIRSNLGSDTGFGISARMGDNEHPLLVISDTRDKGTVVYFEDQENWGEEFKAVTEKIPYREFVALVEGIEDWTAKAESNELYNLLIESMAQGNWQGSLGR